MKEILKNINKKEWRFILLIAILLIIITSIPTIYGFLVKPQDKFFPALRAIGPGDYNVYYSYINQVKEGNFIFNDIFTSEDHSRFLFNPFWLLVGLLGKFFNLSNIFTLQLARVILIFPFLFVLYLLISYFIENNKLRKYFFLFSIFASGLGGFFTPLLRKIYGEGLSLNVYPMDLWVAEGYNFLTLYQIPHFIMATLLIMIIFLLMLLSFEKDKMSYVVWAGLAFLFLIFFHPFHLPTILAVLATYIVVASFRAWKVLWKYLYKFIIFLLISSPAIIYQFFILIHNPVAIGRALQNICFTTEFWIVLISYGLLLVFGLWGIIRKTKNSKYTFLLTWLIVQFLLIFSPLFYQRRLTQGLQIPLTIFAFWGLYYLYEKIRKKWPGINLSNYSPIIILLFVIFFSFSNLYVLAQDMSLYTYSKYREWPHYIYLDKEYEEAFLWLKNNLDQNDVILSSTTTGSFIPGFSAKRVYIGHWVETLNWFDKKENIEWFYDGQGSDKEYIDFLMKNKISYIFYSQFERGYGELEWDKKEYLKPVFDQGKVLIYKVL